MSTPAATVGFRFLSNTGTADTNLFRVFPVDTVLSDGSVITKGLAIRLTPNASGYAQTNLALGDYLVTNQFLGRGYIIRVPLDTGPTIYCGTCSTEDASTNLAISGLNRFITITYGTAAAPTYNQITNALQFLPLTAAQATNLAASAIPTNYWSTSAALWISNVAFLSTNGLAGTNYVNSATNGLAGTNYVNTATNGLAGTNYVNVATNTLTPTNMFFVGTNWVQTNLATRFTVTSNALQLSLDGKSGTNVANSITTGPLKSNDWATFNAKADTTITNGFVVATITNGLIALTDAVARNTVVSNAVWALISARQFGSATLSNLVSTGAWTNQINPGANITFTTNAGIITITGAAGSGSGVSVIASTLLSGSTNGSVVTITALSQTNNFGNIAYSNALNFYLNNNQSNYIGAALATNVAVKAAQDATNAITGASITGAVDEARHATNADVALSANAIASAVSNMFYLRSNNSNFVAVAAGSRISISTNAGVATLSADVQTNGFGTIVYSNKEAFYLNNNQSNYTSSSIATNIADAAALRATNALGTAAYSAGSAFIASLNGRGTNTTIVASPSVQVTNLIIATNSGQIIFPGPTTWWITNGDGFLLITNSDSLSWKFKATGTFTASDYQGDGINLSNVNAIGLRPDKSVTNLTVVTSPMLQFSNSIFHMVTNYTASTNVCFAIKGGTSGAEGSYNFSGTTTLFTNSNGNGFTSTNNGSVIAIINTSGQTVHIISFSSIPGAMTTIPPGTGTAWIGYGGLRDVRGEQIVGELNSTNLNARLTAIVGNYLSNYMTGATLSNLNLKGVPILGNTKPSLMHTNLDGNGNNDDLVVTLFYPHKTGLVWAMPGQGTIFAIYGDTNHSGSANSYELHIDSAGDLSINPGYGGAGGRIQLGATGYKGIENTIQYGDAGNTGFLGLSAGLQFVAVPKTNGVIINAIFPAAEIFLSLSDTNGSTASLDFYNPGPTRSGANFDFSTARKQMSLLTNGANLRGKLIQERQTGTLSVVTNALDFGLGAYCIDLSLTATNVRFYTTNSTDVATNYEKRVFIIRSTGTIPTLAWPSTWTVLTNGGLTTLPATVGPGMIIKLEIESVGAGESNKMVSAWTGPDNTWSWDTDFTLFAASVGAGNLTVAQSNAVNNLVLAAKSHGWWTNCDFIYPFVGGTSNAHALNLKVPSTFAITFVGTVTHNSMGATFDGSTGYGNTGFNPSTAAGIYARDSAHLSAYVITNFSSTSALIGAVSGVPSYASMQAGGANALVARGPQYSGTAVSAAVGSDYRGLMLITRTNSSIVAVSVRGGTYSVSGASTSTVLPNAVVYIGAENNGGLWVPTATTLAFATAGGSVPVAMRDLMNADIDTFQFTLGRKFP